MKDEEPGLSANQFFLDSIIENLPNMVFVKDARELRFVRMNKAGEELLGIDRNELLGKNDFDLFPQDEASFFIQKDREVLESRQLLDIHTEPIQTRFMGTRILHTKKIPLLDEKGEPQYLLGISEDVTERVEAEQQLQQARDAAEAANQAKNEFLARMSHELRTPLNSILGFAQLIQLSDQGLSDEIENITKAGRHLLQLINEVLDLSQIETGRLAMSIEPTDVDVVIREALDITRPLAIQANIALEWSESQEQICVHADKGRLRQVLVNLIANAIKYNKLGGSVNIKVTPKETCADIEVADTGHGISEAHMKELFIPFNRLDAASSHIEGTGLGLALSKTLIESMHGTISVESKIGSGTKFTVEVLVASNELSSFDELEATTAAKQFQELTASVLYVEDNPSNVDLMRATCALWPGVSLVVRTNGASGIQAINELLPDLVLLDLHLPDMSGIDVLKQIKADEKTNSIPVVVLTANAIPDAIKETMRSGASAYITKPFDIDQLFEAIKELTDQSR